MSTRNRILEADDGGEGEDDIRMGKCPSVRACSEPTAHCRREPKLGLEMPKSLNLNGVQKGCDEGTQAKSRTNVGTRAYLRSRSLQAKRLFVRSVAASADDVM